MILALLPFIAATPVPPSEAVGDWLAIFFYLSGSAAALVVAYKKIRAKDPEPAPQPFTVRPHVEYTPIGLHNALALQVREKNEDTDRRFLAMASASSASRDKIYNLIRSQGEELSSEISTVREMSARAAEKTDLTNAQVNRLDSKIDRVLENQARRQNQSS
jgi:hypothetical protein